MSDSLANADMHRRLKGRHLYEVLTLIQSESTEENLKRTLQIWLERTHLGQLPR